MTKTCKQLVFIYFFTTMCLSATAQQHFYISFTGGIAGYKGDLGSSNVVNLNGMGGIGAVVELNHRMLIRGELNYGKLSGSDKFSLKSRSRNLSFSTKLTEFALLFEYVLFDLYEYKVSPYLFAGVGTFKFSPYTKDERGNIVMLAELSTEGQGFYKDRKDYKLNKLAIPFGGGMQWALSDRTRLTLETGIRKTNTDYIDDVSTTYVDPVLLESKKGGTAVKLAYRGDELPNSKPYPAADSKRGNPDNKDWYVFSSLSLRISLQPRPRDRGYSFPIRRAKTSCPTVY